MIDIEVNLDTRPLIVVVHHHENESHEMDVRHFQLDRYARKRNNARVKHTYRHRAFMSFDNAMISVSSYFVCPKDLLVVRD